MTDAEMLRVDIITSAGEVMPSLVLYSQTTICAWTMIWLHHHHFYSLNFFKLITVISSAAEPGMYSSDDANEEQLQRLNSLWEASAHVQVNNITTTLHRVWAAARRFVLFPAAKGIWKMA